MSPHPSSRNTAQPFGLQREPERRRAMTPKGIETYRARMLQLCPAFTEAHLTQFVQSCFASPQVVMAYSSVLHLPVVVDVAGKPIVAEALPRSRFEAQQTVCVIPFQAALEASRSAQSMKILDDESDSVRRLTALATLLRPCGLFVINDLAIGQGVEPGETLAQAQWRHQRQALGHAVAVLNERSPDAGRLLSFTLGLSFKGGVPAQRATKMVTAIMLSSLRLRHLWSSTALSRNRAPQ